LLSLVLRLLRPCTPLRLTQVLSAVSFATVPPSLHSLHLFRSNRLTPHGSPVLARSSTVLLCLAVPSGSLSRLHLPSFSTNLVRQQPPAHVASCRTRLSLAPQWLTRDTVARLAIRNHLPLAECAHFRQHKTVKALYDAVVTRYSSPTTAALGRLLLPYLCPELSAFATVEDFVTHLRTSDDHYRAALTAEFLDRNPPPMDHFLSLDPTALTVDLLEQHLLAAETSVVAVGAARCTPRTPFFEGCSSPPLAPSYASAPAVDVLGAEDVGAASASGKRRNSKGKGGRGGGGGSGGRGGGSSGGGGGSGGGGIGDSGSGGGRAGATQRGGSGGGQRQQQLRGRETLSPQQLSEWFSQRGPSGGSVSCPYVIRTADHAGQTCGKPHTQHRCFSRLDDAWRAEFGDEAERPRWAELLSESALSGTAPAKALHTFTLDSGASRCFFQDNTNLFPLSALVQVKLADPSGGQVLAHSSTILLCPAFPSGSLSGLHLPSFFTNLGRERYFLLVVDDYTRYTTVFHLRCKGEVLDVLIPWIRAARLQLRERFRQDLPVLRLHSDSGGEFSSDLLQDFCRGERILLSFTLLASPQKNGIAECRIGLVMEVWGSCAFVRDTSADKFSALVIPCVFLCFSPDAPGWLFYHSTLRRVLPSQDVMFDESVPFYRLFPYRSSPPPPPPLFLAPGPPLVDPLPPPGSCSLRCVSSRPSLWYCVVSGTTGAGGTVRPRPYFVPLLQEVLGSATLLCPPPDQSQPLLQPASPLHAPSTYSEQTRVITERHEPESSPASLVCAVRIGRRIPRPRLPPVPGTTLWHFSNLARAANPTVSRLLATVVTDPSFESTAASPLVPALSASPPSVGGECALGTDVLEDKHEEFECLAAAVPSFASMLLAPEGDPDEPDIPTPRSYAEAITGPYSSQWQAAMDAEMASWKFTGTYVDTVPPSRANIVDVMWIFRWSLHQPVYGLRQAPCEWHNILRTTLAALGFTPSTADPSLFLRTDTSLSLFYVLVYVIQRFGFQFSSPQPTPLSTNHSLSAPPSDKSVEPSGPYPELVGCLISSCEAEIYVGAMAAQELRWLTYLLTDLGEKPRLPPVLYVDNKAMIALCQEHRLEHRTKHIALRYFLARELQQRGQLRLAYVATRANTADIFTKAL
ncbi:unnamed protein product, partial [Closterium sp. NIES-53]